MYNDLIFEKYDTVCFHIVEEWRNHLPYILYSRKLTKTHTLTWFLRTMTQCVSRSLNNWSLNTYQWDAFYAWYMLNKTFKPMTGETKTRLCKKFFKSKLYVVTREPEDWITELELLRDDLWTLGDIIDGVEIMTHIVSNIPEE